MGIEFALIKVREGRGTDLHHFVAVSDADLRTEIIIGVAGNALGKTEYIGSALPDATLSQPVWKITKLVYDASGNVIRILYADGSEKFDKTMSAYAGYTYSET
jgi:YD repeat-containing protein